MSTLKYDPANSQTAVPNSSPASQWRSPGAAQLSAAHAGAAAGLRWRPGCRGVDAPFSGLATISSVLTTDLVEPPPLRSHVCTLACGAGRRRERVKHVGSGGEAGRHCALGERCAPKCRRPPSGPRRVWPHPWPPSPACAWWPPSLSCGSGVTFEGGLAGARAPRDRVRIQRRAAFLTFDRSWVVYRLVDL